MHTRPGTLRIAVWHNLPSGGGKRALYDHVRGLVQRGHHVEVWRPPAEGDEYLPLQTIAHEHIVPLAWDDRRQSRSLARLGAAVDRLRAAEAHCRRCAAEINQGAFHLVYAGACRFLSAPPLARFLRVPAVLYLAEPHRRLYEALPRPPWAALPWPSSPLAMLRDEARVRNQRILVREETRNAAAFDRVLTNSLYSRESLLRAYGIEAHVCYLGIDTALFVDRGAQRAHALLGVGALAPEKNVAGVIRAVAALPSPRPPLLWVGNVAAPRYLNDMRQLALSLGVSFEPRVNVSDAELIDLYNYAAVMVFAPRLEPFGLAPLEAGACGLPVVAVAEGGVRETVIDGVNGLLVSHSDELPAAVQRLLDDPDLARRLGRQATEHVRRRWSLSAAIDRLEQELLTAARPPTTR